MTDYQQILERIEGSGIPTCILHGWQAARESSASDLDIAVRPGDLAALSRLLAEPGAARCVQLIRHESTCSYFVLAVRDGLAVRFLRLDVAADFRRDGRIFLTAEELFRDRWRLDGVWLSAPGVELPYLLVKKVLKERLPPHQGERLRCLLAELGPDGERIVQGLLGWDAGNLALRWIRAGAWQQFVAALPRLKRMLLRRSFLRRPLAAVRYATAELWRVALRILHPTGLFVAVMGPDGAGKTALIAGLRTSMQEAFRSSALFHLRPGVLGARRGGDPSRPHEKPAYSGPLSVLKMAFLAADYVLGYLTRVRPQLVRSSLVLFDRYFDDHLVDPLRYRFGGPGWTVRLAQRFVPRPDLFLFLDAPVDLLLSRKTELPAGELERQREAYRRLAAGLPNAVLLDGSLPEAEVARNAVEVLLHFMSERYVARRRVWFRDEPGAPARMLLQALAQRLPPAQDGSARSPAERRFSLLAFGDGRGFLVPRDSRQAASRALGMYNAQNRKARAAKALLEVLLWAGIPVLPRVTIPAESRVIEILDHVERIIGGGGLSFAMSLGTPGAHRKPVIEAFDSSGIALAFVKVGWDAGTRDLVRNETLTLQSLAGMTPRTFVRPQVRHARPWGDLLVLVTDARPERTLNAPRTLTPAVVEVLREMQAMHFRRMALADSSFWKRLALRARSAANAHHRGILREGIGYLERLLQGRLLPFHFSHGDFTPWNMVKVKDGILLFDWEYADPEAPAGYDLFHFHVQTGFLLQRREPAGVYGSLFGGAEKGLPGDLAGLIGDRELARPLLLMYLMDRIAFYACYLDGHFQTLMRLSRLMDICREDGAGFP